MSFPNLKQSIEMQARARRRIPGMTQLLSKRPDMFSEGVWPGYFSRAHGSRIWDLDGNEYTDMSISGIGANILGYCDPDVDAAVLEAVKNGTSSSLNCPEEVELADLLCELHPWAQMVRYARSGGETMTIAIRIARAHTDRDVIAFCGYHGWHDWYLSANLGTENALGEHLISGLNPAGVPRGLAHTSIPFRYNQLDELQAIVRQHGQNLAAVVMEPIRNIDPAPGFLEGVRSVADETGAVMIVDEISAGFRINTGGAHRVLFPVDPDLAVFSKALGNGYPIGAVIGREAIMQAAQKTFISSTYWTERIGPTAALATIRKHRAVNAAAHLIALGERVQKGWQDAAARCGIRVHVGGMKPAGHFSFEQENPQALKAYFIQLMLEQGFLASNLYYAMCAHTQEDVSRYLAAVENAFHDVADAVTRGDVESRLRGKPSTVGFRRLN